jgi:hypothetical protein
MTGEEKRTAAKLDGPCGWRVAQWSNIMQVVVECKNASKHLFSHAVRCVSEMQRMSTLEKMTDRQTSC